MLKDRFLMTFLKPGLIVASSLLLVSACGGGDTPTDTAAETPAANDTVTEVAATPEPETPATDPEAAETVNAFAALPEPRRSNRRHRLHHG